MTFETRNAIVTGSTSGIGLAIARALGRRQRDEQRRGRRRAIEAERAGMAKEAEAKLGSVDILVNAGFSMSRRSRNFRAKTGTGSLHQSLRRVP